MENDDVDIVGNYDLKDWPVCDSDCTIEGICEF